MLWQGFGCWQSFLAFRGRSNKMIDSIKRFFGITPNVYSLPYQQRIYVIALSTAVERVR